MELPVAYLWVENPRNERLARAQVRLEESVLAHGLQPLRFTVGRALVPLGDVLKRARACSEGSAFVWCNSDLIVTKNPFDVPDPDKVCGFIRRELPSNEFNCGVDMYYIPLRWWDDYLSMDIPQLYLGAAYVDWWVSRAMQKVQAYENLKGYIDHITHPQSADAGSDASPYYQKNFRSYNRWAKRNGLEPISAPPFLVHGIGHVWGVRSLIQRLLKR